MDGYVDTGEGMRLRERPQRKYKNKLEELKFMNDFDPEKSNREKRKLKRKVAGSTSNKTTVYDEVGCIRSTGKSVCDCMNNECTGCWFECENCGSKKCGVQCRVNRKFFYEYITFDGKDNTIFNKNVTKNK